MLSEIRPADNLIFQFIENYAAIVQQLDDQSNAVTIKMNDALKRIKALEKEYEINLMIISLYLIS